MVHNGRAIQCCAAYQSMERMLKDLGARWAAVCQGIDDKWLHLQDFDMKWRSYHSNADHFNAWLDEQEVLLGRMRLSDISDPQILLNQVRYLKVCRMYVSGLNHCLLDIVINNNDSIIHNNDDIIHNNDNIIHNNDSIKHNDYNK